MKQLLYLILVIILISGCRNRYKPTPEEIIMLQETLREFQMNEAIEKAKRGGKKKILGKQGQNLFRTTQEEELSEPLE